MRLYVAGPMGGMPNLNHPMFDRVTAALREQGHVVLSPAEKDREWGLDPAKGQNSLDAHKVLAWDLQAILNSEGICLLPGWRNSEGARLEVIVAVSTGRRLFYWSERGQEMIDLPLSETEGIVGIPSYARKVPA